MDRRIPAGPASRSSRQQRLPEAATRLRFVLVGEAVLLMKDAIAENVHGHGLSPFKDLLRKVIDAKIPVYM